MLTLTVISSVLTIAFFAVIVVLVWYVRHMFKSIVYLNENHKDLLVMLQHYSDHVKSVHEMEMFYGDETLNSLLHHAASFNEYLETFEYIYSLTEETTPEGNPPEDDGTEEETQEEDS